MRLQNYSSATTQIQPRGGRSTVHFQTTLLKRLAMAGANVLPITVDSNTRLEKYAEAQTLYLEALETGTDSLNGFPFMAISNQEIVHMLSGFSQPVSLRHGSPIAHQLVQKALACGIDEIEGGPLTYSLPYTRKTPLKEAILSWELVEQLCAQSKSRLNQPILRESFGVLTAVLVPPYMALLISFLEAIFSYRNGVRHFMVGLQSCGNVLQDIVQFEAARSIESTLRSGFFPNMHIYYAYHHWMGPFPRDSREANSVIDICNLSAYLVKADKVVVKTNVEAFGVPSEEANARAVTRTKKLLSLLERELFVWSENVNEEESQLLASEVLLGLEFILRDKGINQSLIHAVEFGWIDLMFSPHSSVQRNLEVHRDNHGWIRIHKAGNLQLSRKYVDFEKRSSQTRNEYLPSDQIVIDMLWPKEFNYELAQRIRDFATERNVRLDDE